MSIGTFTGYLVYGSGQDAFEPPVLFTLRKSTEPWSDDYYTFNVEAAMQSIGLEDITTVSQ